MTKSFKFTCDICNKTIYEDKDDYEIHEIYIKGDHEDSFICHTYCRIKQDEEDVS